MTNAADWFSQQGYRCRFDWGRHGVQEAAKRGDVVVIVDVLSFSTAVAAAVAQGGLVFPCREGEDAEALANRIGGEAAVHRGDVPARGRFSLSPQTFETMEPGARVVLPSPNGATCSRYGAMAPVLFAGALVNAQAVAQAVSAVIAATDLAVTVVACGERQQAPSEDGDLRFAVEDYLGTGAILSHWTEALSPEAQVCADAFRQAADTLAETVWECGSGWELRAKGFGEDVRLAARLDRYDSAPRLRDGAFTRGD